MLAIQVLSQCIPQLVPNIQQFLSRMVKDNKPASARDVSGSIALYGQ